MASSSLEIPGLCSTINGRSCTAHALYGDHVNPGDVLQLVKCAVEHNSKVKEAIKCIKVIDGVDTCTVACLPWNCLAPPKVQNHIDKFVQMVELCGHSKNAHKLTKPVPIAALHPLNCWTRTKATMNEQNMNDMTKN